MATRKRKKKEPTIKEFLEAIEPMANKITGGLNTVSIEQLRHYMEHGTTNLPKCG